MNIISSKRKIEDIDKPIPEVNHVKKQRLEAPQKSFDDLPYEIKCRIFFDLLPTDPKLRAVTCINRCNHSTVEAFFEDLQIAKNPEKTSENLEENLESLPIEVKTRISEYLSMKDLLNLRLVSKNLENASNLTVKSKLKKRKYVIKPLYNIIYLRNQIKKLLSCPDVFCDESFYPYYKMNLKKLDFFPHADYFFKKFNKELSKLTKCTNIDEKFQPRELKLYCNKKILKDLENNLKSFMNENLKKLVVHSSNCSIFLLFKGKKLEKLESLCWKSQQPVMLIKPEMLIKEDVTLLEQACPNLKRLDFSNNIWFSPDFVNELINSKILKNLDFLILNGHMEISDFCSLIKSEHSSGITHLGFPKKYLLDNGQLVDFENLEEKEILQIAAAFNESKMQLTSIHTTNPLSVIKIILSSENFQNLQQIKIASNRKNRVISLELFKKLLEAPHLKKLDLWFSLAKLEKKAINEEDFSLIFSQFVKKQMNLPPLTKLYLSHFYRRFHNEILAEKTLISHVKFLQIQSQDIDRCFDDDSKIDVSHIKQLSIIKSRRLRLTPRDLNTFLQGMKSIEFLSIKAVPIDDETIDTIKNMNNLQKLVINDVDLSWTQAMELFHMNISELSSNSPFITKLTKQQRKFDDENKPILINNFQDLINLLLTVTRT